MTWANNPSRQRCQIFSLWTRTGLTRVSEQDRWCSENNWNDNNTFVVFFSLPFLYLPTILLGLYETKSCMLHGSGSFFISSRTLSKDGRESWLLGVGFRMSGVARSLGLLWTEGTGSAERTATMGWDCSEDPFNVTTSGLDFVSCLGSGRVPSSELVFWTA